MKKIGIITLYGQYNYGNRLQNYASQFFLEMLGFAPVSFVESVKRPLEKKSGILFEMKYQIMRFSNFRLSKNPNAWLKYDSVRRRSIAFSRFQKKIKTEYITDLSSLSEKADYFVTGSDQVWQPIWWEHHDQEMYLLSFAKPEQKLCLSPSFGVGKLDENYTEIFRSALSSFSLLNSRENAGVAIIKDLTGKNVEVTLDPTLMLSENDWRKVSRKPKTTIKKPYILTYFLGKIPEQADADIHQLCSNNPELTVYRMNDPSSYDMYACGPSEFLYMIDHAKIILTDSFHACIFSFLFEKPFLVYNRAISNSIPLMTSRIETLLTLLDLTKKYRVSQSAIDWFENDYHVGKNKLISEKEKLAHMLQYYT